MSEKVYPLFEFYHTNVGGIYILDVSKGLVERVYVEALSADDANDYMESLGADFNEYCHCCGNRWYRASKPTPRGEDDDVSIDVRYSREPVAIHKIDGSFVIWEPKRYAKPEPKSAEEALEIKAIEEERIVRREAEARAEAEACAYEAEVSRINEALKPRYNAYASECGADCGPEYIAVKPNMFLLSRAIKL